MAHVKDSPDITTLIFDETRLFINSNNGTFYILSLMANLSDIMVPFLLILLLLLLQLDLRD